MPIAAVIIPLKGSGEMYLPDPESTSRPMCQMGAVNIRDWRK